MDVYGRDIPLTSDTVVLINAWEPHSYVGSRGGPAFLLAFFLDPAMAFRLAVAAARVPVRAALRPADDRIAATGRSFRRATCCTILRSTNPFLNGLWERSRSKRRVSANTTNVGARPPTFGFAGPSITSAINPGSHLDTAELASVSGLSIPHFFERFKECTGVTPRSYVKVVKIEHAFNALTSGNSASAKYPTTLDSKCKATSRASSTTSGNLTEPLPARNGSPGRIAHQPAKQCLIAAGGLFDCPFRQ